MYSKTNLAGLLAVCLAGLVLALAWGQDAAPSYVKNAMCLACHKGRNPGLADRYLATKHSQAVPGEDMTPLDIYRRSVGFKSADNSFYEKGVGCQSCHAPGGAHLKAKGDEEKKATMQRMDALEKPTQKLSVCGRCHGQYTIDGKPFAEGFKIGDDRSVMVSRWSARPSRELPRDDSETNSGRLFARAVTNSVSSA